MFEFIFNQNLLFISSKNLAINHELNRFFQNSEDYNRDEDYQKPEQPITAPFV
ncbi:hypothetical protein [Cytobacillus sp. FSL R5-0596]|uniref:hypothetical protein n=1 Tax=Cytobacillus sp. FSL R5-0596 TaxID=2954696 RepID=UPI0030F75EE8